MPVTDTTELHYRYLVDDADERVWYVSLQCGSMWLIVFGPGSEAQAREWIDGMTAQGL